MIAGLENGILLMKADSTGNLQWTKRYNYALSTGNGTWDHAYSVAPTFDGGYIISGSVFYIGPMYSDAFLIKTDALGDTVWTKIFNYGYQDAISVVETHDSSYLMTTEGFLIYNVNRSGDTIWTKQITPSNSLVKDVIQCSDHGFVFTGRSGSGGIFLLKTDSLCNPIWAKSYLAFNESTPYNIHQTFDGGFIISGYAVLHDSINHDFFYAIKVNSNGDTLWSKVIPESFLCYINQTSDTGFISAGTSSSDIALFKMNSEGNIFCNESPATTTVLTPLFQVSHLPISIVDSYFYYTPLTINDSSGINVSTVCFSINDHIPKGDDNSLSFIIYPNPFHTSASINSSFSFSDVQIKIYNSLGMLLRIDKISNLSSYILHRDGLSDGLYFFQLSTFNSQPISAGKFIVE